MRNRLTLIIFFQLIIEKKTSIVKISYFDTMNMASSASSTPSPNPTNTANGGGSGPPSAGASGQTSNNSSLNAGQQQQGASGNNPANDGPVSSERIACWITELLSSSTRENALMELSRKREKVTDLAVLLWHSFGSVAVLLHEVM